MGRTAYVYLSPETELSIIRRRTGFLATINFQESDMFTRTSSVISAVVALAIAGGWAWAAQQTGTTPANQNAGDAQGAAREVAKQGTRGAGGPPAGAPSGPEHHA